MSRALKLENMSFVENANEGLVLFDSDEMFRWTAKSKREYERIEKRINKIGKETTAFAVYAWYDVSGFDYWVRRQREPNYIQVTVSIKKTLNAKQLQDLKNTIDAALCDAECIQSDCEQDLIDLETKEIENE